MKSLNILLLVGVLLVLLSLSSVHSYDIDDEGYITGNPLDYIMDQSKLDDMERRHENRSHHHGHRKHHRCLDKSKKGYTTYFGVTSNNAYFPGPNGTLTPMSFFEIGNTSVDFSTQRLRVNFRIFSKAWGMIDGSLWGFGQSNEMYILQNNTCTKLPLWFPIPSGFHANQTTYLGKVKLGQFKVVMLAVQAQNNQSSYVNQTVLYDPKNCACVTSYIHNRNWAKNPGFANIEFFKYRNHFSESYFDLPPQCGGNNVTVATIKSIDHDGPTKTITLHHPVHRPFHHGPVFHSSSNHEENEVAQQQEQKLYIPNYIHQSEYHF